MAINNLLDYLFTVSVSYFVPKNFKKRKLSQKVFLYIYKLDSINIDNIAPNNVQWILQIRRLKRDNLNSFYELCKKISLLVTNIILTRIDNKIFNLSEILLSLYKINLTIEEVKKMNLTIEPIIGKLILEISYLPYCLFTESRRYHLLDLLIVASQIFYTDNIYIDIISVVKSPIQ